MSSWMWLRSWSVSIAGQATAFPLGRKALHPPPGPFVGIARVQEAVVEPERATLPELDRVWGQAVSTPMRGPRDGSVPEAGQHLLDPSLALAAVAQHRALRRCPRPDLRLARPGGEVGVRLVVFDPSNAAADGDLPVELLPEEHDRRSRVLVQLSTLTAPVVRVEDEASSVGLAAQDGPDRRLAVGSR